MVDINKLTIGEAREIAKLFGLVDAVSVPMEIRSTSSYIKGDGRAVIVRAKDAGVHFGYLVGYEGRRVDLTNSRRMWQWTAKEDGSLSGVAVYGVSASGSKIAAKVDKIVILDACEIIDVTEVACKTIEAAKWA